MPLPVLSSGLGALGQIKSRLSGNKPASTPTPTREAANDSNAVAAPQSKPVIKTPRPLIWGNNPRSSIGAAADVRSNLSSLGAGQAASNETANQKAIARSRAMDNPLLPILHQINSTMIGSNKILEDILKKLDSIKMELGEGAQKSGMGLDDTLISAAAGAAIGKKIGKPKVPRGKPSFKGRMMKGGLYGVLAGLAGWGASKFFGASEETAEDIGTVTGTAGGLYGFKTAKGPILPPTPTPVPVEPVPPGAPAQKGWFGKAYAALKGGGTKALDMMGNAGNTIKDWGKSGAELLKTGGTKAMELMTPMANSVKDWGKGAFELLKGTGGGKTGEVLSKMGQMGAKSMPFLKTTGRIGVQTLGPILSLIENSDELLNTGAIDPVKQVEKMGSGLGKMFDVNSPLFSMKRVEGLGDVLSGGFRNIIRWCDNGS